MWRRLLGGAHASAGSQEPGADASKARRLVVLDEGPSASADYILSPWLATLGPPVHRLDARQAPRTGQLQPGDFVVVQRYLHADWQRAIQRQRGELWGLAWFLDDDLLDPVALAELDDGYASKIRRLALARRAWFEQMGSQWWVATEALARKYSDSNPRLIPFAPPASLTEARSGILIGYHGTASHQAELDWLVDVIHEVQHTRVDTQFEVFGDLSVNRRFRELPRVAVLHPMRWESYLSYTATRRLDIGLAPLLPGVFNAGRGPVKWADYTRQGAIGLFSRVPPFEGFIRHEVDGVLLPNEPSAWVEAILRWADDAPARADVVAAARARAASAG